MPSDSSSMPPAVPRLSGHVHVAPTADELYDRLAAVLVGSAIRAVGERGVFHLALSGGSTPEPFYMRLVIDPRYRLIPWQQTHLWLVDERRVDEDDPRSNFNMIRQCLADHLPMRRRQMHPMPVLLDDPATIYEEELRRVFRPTDAGIEPVAALYQRVPRLDFVVLGMGDDGHTASLFPDSPAVHEQERWVTVNQGPAVTPPPRVSMTFPLLNAARELAVLVTGPKKAPTIRRVEQQLRSLGPDPVKLPITGIQPMDGSLGWFLDHPAAGLPEPDANTL